jgi:hypothetical protein
MTRKVMTQKWLGHDSEMTEYDSEMTEYDKEWLEYDKVWLDSIFKLRSKILYKPPNFPPSR